MCEIWRKAQKAFQNLRGTQADSQQHIVSHECPRRSWMTHFDRNKSIANKSQQHSPVHQLPTVTTCTLSKGNAMKKIIFQLCILLSCTLVSWFWHSTFKNVFNWNISPRFFSLEERGEFVSINPQMSEMICNFHFFFVIKWNIIFFLPGFFMMSWGGCWANFRVPEMCVCVCLWFGCC